MKKINKSILFLVLTLGSSYLIAGLFYLINGEYTGISGIIFATCYMLIPAIAAVIVEKFIHRQELKQHLFISFKLNKWFFVAWIIPPFLGFGTFGISLLFPQVSFSPDMAGMFDRYADLLTPEQMNEMKNSLETIPIHPVLLTLFQGLMAGITINAVLGLGEELGWRGFLVRQFVHKPFMKTALIIGFVWGIWHAPIVLMGHNYPHFPVLGVFMMTVWCILLSPLFLYVTIKAKSVIAAAILHGTLNGTVGLSILMVAGGNELIVGSTGLSGFIALIILTLGIFVYDNFVSKEKIMLGAIKAF